MRLIKAMICFSCLLMLSAAHAQYPILEKGTPLKPGIYRNLKELQTNNPSIPLQYAIRTSRYHNNFTRDEVNYYNLKVSKKKAKQVGFIYGFCDGERIYLNSNQPTWLSKNQPYFALDFTGRYNYFPRMQSDGFSLVHVPTGTGVTTTGSSGKIVAFYIFDMHTGEFVESKKSTLPEQLSPYPELARQYKEHKRERYKTGQFTKLLAEYKNKAL